MFDKRQFAGIDAEFQIFRMAVQRREIRPGVLVVAEGVRRIGEAALGSGIVSLVIVGESRDVVFLYHNAAGRNIAAGDLAVHFSGIPDQPGVHGVVSAAVVDLIPGADIAESGYIFIERF